MPARPVLAVLTAAITLASPFAVPAASADSAGTLLIPLHNMARPRAASIIGAGTTGFAYMPDADDGSVPSLIWQPYDGSAATTIPAPTGPLFLSVAGDSVAYTTGSSNSPTVHLLDMDAGGAESTIALPSPSRYYGATAGGVYYDNVNQYVGGYGNHLFIKYLDGHTSDLGDVGTGAIGQGIATDAGGAAFMYGSSDGKAHLAYADTATHVLRDVVSGAQSGIYSRPTLTADNVLWHLPTGPDSGTNADEHAIFWQPRSGGATHMVDLTFDTTYASFSQIGSSLAIQTSMPSALQTVPLTGGTPTATGQTVYSWAAAPDGTLIAELGADSAAHAIGRLTDSSTTSLVTLPPRPAPVMGLALSGRRLVSIDASALPTWLGSEQLTPSGPLAVSSTTTIEPDASHPGFCGTSCGSLFASGHRTAYAIQGGYELRDGARVTSHLLSASLSYGISNLWLAGRSVLVQSAAYWAVWDTETGKWKLTVPGESAVLGSTVWEPVIDSNTGLDTSFNAVDVDTGTTKTSFNIQTPCHVSGTTAVGQWVGWWCWQGTGSGFHNTVTGADVTLSTQNWMLGDNYVAYVDSGTGSDVLTVQDLTNPAAAPMGLATLPTGSRWAVDNGGGQTVAYADTDGTHVIPVPVPAGALTLMDDAIAPHFAPVQAPWAPKWDLSKPATWTLTVSQGGTAVRHLSGNADDGGARPEWDGRDDDGNAVPRGDYSWSFSAAAADGDASTYTADGAVTVGDPPAVTITSSPATLSASSTAMFSFATTGLDMADVTTTCSLDGGAAATCTSPFTATGLSTGGHTLTVHTADTHGAGGSATFAWSVDTTAPTVTTTAMPSFTAGSSLSFSYAGHDVGSGVASYDVKYRRAGPSGAWSADQYPSAWQHITSAKVTRTETAGYTDCFSVRLRDKAGNTSAWSALRCTAVILDDRSLSVSAGWSRLTGTAFYLHTETQSATLSAALTRTSSTFDRMALLVTRCNTCGSLRVYIAGHYLTTVSLYSSTRQYRSLIVLSAFSSRSGIVKLVISSSRKLVQVDGIGLSRA